MKPAVISVAILACLLVAGPAFAQEENPWAPKPTKKEPHLPFVLIPAPVQHGSDRGGHDASLDPGHAAG